MADADIGLLLMTASAAIAELDTDFIPRSKHACHGVFVTRKGPHTYDTCDDKKVSVTIRF